mmetsp:Transcript_46086/g.53162  ORF Transcript_46086/g.53162 Transcript_46086/m.53162 type:complete len:135 (-) Transcript_46086:157-561(-)
MDTQFRSTTPGNPNNQAQNSLKGKLINYDETVKALTEELNFHKKELQILRSERDTLENVLSMKTQDVRKSLINEVNRIEDEMKKHFSQQKSENSRLQQQITALKSDKTSLQKELIGLQRRLAELEMQIGEDDGH